MKGRGKTKSEKVRMALLFTFSLLLFTSAARAEELQPVPYLDWDAETRQMTNAVCTTYKVVESTDWPRFDAGTTYVVTGAVEVTGIISVGGTVANPTRLILCDGAKLTVGDGVVVRADDFTTNALVICGQTLGSGTLEATGRGGAGIGCGGRGAGGMVTINGGTVTANGGTNSAGIGGGIGGAGGAVTINGGTVTATGGQSGAGIGGGADGAGGAVTINGGTVTAKGGQSGAGIGGGNHSAGGAVTINGGTVTANGDMYGGAGIGGGNGSTDHGSVAFGAGKWLVKAGSSAQGANPVTVEAYKGDHSAAYVQIRSLLQMEPVLYLDWNAEKQALVEASTTEYVVYDADAGLVEGVTYVVTGVVAVARSITVNGTVASPTRLILCDGAKLTASKGVVVKADDQMTNALVICGQTVGSGTLEATGGTYAAGIGGGNGGAGGMVTINGGTVKANGGTNGAGIGGGNGGAGGAVTINGGTVTATGAQSGAGIGGGYVGAGGTVTINGGTVMATGGGKGAGIGGGLGRTDPGSVSFGAGGWQILAGINAQGAEPVTVDEYVADHSAAYAQIVPFVAEVISADGTQTNAYTTLNEAWGDLGKEQSSGKGVTNTVRLLSHVQGNLTVEKGNATTLDLNGWTLTGDGTASVITIKSGSALTLTDTSAKQTGTVTMPERAQGPSFGGGVNNSGTFTMTGGTITGCTATQSGGGVCNGGTFTMSGGTIAGCTARYGGGVYNNSTFTMSGGTISGCKATTQGGGVYNNNSTFTLSGGTISGCKATTQGGGVYNFYSTFTLSGGAVENAIAKSGTKNPSISGGLFGKETVGDSNFSKWIASGAKTADNPDEATKEAYPSVVRGKDNCVVMVRMEGLQSVVVSNGTEAVAGYPAADYRIFEVGKGATVSLAYVPAEGRELKEEAPTSLAVDKDMVVYPVKSLGPTCDGGTIEKGDGGWVVTPTNGATKVVITGLAEGETVAGVRLGDYVVPSGAFDGFGEGKTEGEFSLALDPAGVVTIGTETIRVQPTIGEGVEDAFTVGGGRVAVKVKSIPGLRYTLQRMVPMQESGVVFCDTPMFADATETRVMLKDANATASAAFYRVTVSVPGWDSQSESYGSTDDKPTPKPTANDGVRIEGGKVFSGDFEITGAVTVRSDGSVELNPGGSVGGVRVTPVIGDLPPGDGDETEPFAVGEGSVSLTVQTIPGLTYVLLRGETPDQVDEPVDSGRATKNVMTLEDLQKPKDGAFYQIEILIK